MDFGLEILTASEALNGYSVWIWYVVRSYSSFYEITRMYPLTYQKRSEVAVCVKQALVSGMSIFYSFVR